MPLVVHFLNVGRGDCTIIEFPNDNRVGIVDVFNLKIFDEDTKKELLAEYHESKEYEIAKLFGLLHGRMDEAFLAKKSEELTDPIAYYDTHIGPDKDIFRILITHPDMDHMTGLYRLHWQERGKSLLNFWHTGDENFNLDDTTDKEWENSPYDKRDWETYKILRNSRESPTSLKNLRWATGDFWTVDGVEIWSPSAGLISLAKETQQANVLSMVLKISYKERTIVLGGDATADESWPDILENVAVSKIDVLKASHHGRRTGYHGPAVKQMSPWLTITSVTEKAHDATRNYRMYSDYTVSLRDAKDIRIEIADDGTLYYPPHLKNHWKPKVT
jgi:hypothetical protein